MIKVNGLSKSFKNKQILHSVDIAVGKGDVVALLGPSGAGKTTLLRCMNFLEKADEGMLIFDETKYDMRRISRKQIRDYRLNTSFVFQDYNLFANKTALQNITEGLIVARGMDKSEAEEKAYDALKRVGLSDLAGSYPRQLSGGQSQRVAIARAFATDPKIIFFDEPTSALDPELTEDVLKCIRDLADAGMTMLIVTHEIGFARSVSNKVYLMEDGQMIESGDTETIFENPQTARTAEFLSVGM